jgi:hypothetical protein
MSRSCHYLTLATVALSISCASLAAEEFHRLKVSPSPVELSQFNPTQQLLVTAESADGRLIDVTHDCELSVGNEAVVLSSGATLKAIGTGKSELTLVWKNLRASVPVTVADLSSTPELHFVNDVMPLLSKYGCNSGGCHGKASGQNGFKLSVFGFDPEGDYAALTKESRGRRVVPGVPSQSLLPLKATGRTPHGGGQRIKPDSDDDRLLSEWIRLGMPWGSDSAPTLKSVSVEPADRVADRQASQQLLVTATFSDGSKRDVTSKAAYTSNSPVVADAAPGGIVHTGTVPGEAAITVNYMGQVTVARLLIPLEGPTLSAEELPVHNEIDPLVWTRLRRMGIAPSELCDDATFIRRVFIDAIGTLPKPDEVRSFLTDDSSNKRSQLIDDVLSRSEYADYWSLKWADTLLVDRKLLGERGAFEFHRWLREQMVTNRPYNEWVRELITATGISGKYGPVNFYRALRNPDDAAKGISQAFLGIRMDCAQCHHHPFEKWGQEDFYGMAGIFKGLRFQKLGADRELVSHTGLQETRIPLTNKLVVVRPPDGNEVSATATDPRRELATWMTSDQNPWFARLLANRLWGHFLGRGIIEPVDDLRSTNPPVNEPLMAMLEEFVVTSGYDAKAVTRLIMNSRVYQLSSTPNKTNQRDEQNFSHYLRRRLPAEVLLDAVCEVTQVPEQFPGQPVGTRSIETWDNRLPSYFLDTFGRSLRQSPCECGKSDAPTMSQALHLMNAPEIEARIGSPNGRCATLAASSRSQDDILNEISLAALARMPNEKEAAAARELFQTTSRRTATEDVLWMVLNSYDFLFVK